MTNIYQKIYIDENLNYVESELTTLKNYLIEKIYKKEKQVLNSEGLLNTFKHKKKINLLSEQTKGQISRITNIQSKKKQYQIELQAALESKKTIEEQIKQNQNLLKNLNVQDIDDHFDLEWQKLVIDSCYIENKSTINFLNLRKPNNTPIEVVSELNISNTNIVLSTTSNFLIYIYETVSTNIVFSHSYLNFAVQDIQDKIRDNRDDTSKEFGEVSFVNPSINSLNLEFIK